MAKTEAPKFSAPCLVVKCPSCHVPAGCACRVIDMTGTTPAGRWTTPREPHFARENAYKRWKLALFGDSKSANTGHKLPYMWGGSRRPMQSAAARVDDSNEGLSYIERSIGVGMDPPGSGD